MNKETINKKTREVEQILLQDSKMENKKLMEKYRTSIEGISVVEVDERIEEYGKNIIEVKSNNTFLHKLKEAFINPFNIPISCSFSCIIFILLFSSLCFWDNLSCKFFKL